MGYEGKPIKVDRSPVLDEELLDRLFGGEPPPSRYATRYNTDVWATEEPADTYAFPEHPQLPFDHDAEGEQQT